MTGGNVAKIQRPDSWHSINLPVPDRSRARVVVCDRQGFSSWGAVEHFIGSQIARGRACRVERKPWGYIVEVFA